ncbi:carboxypeptidase regulatory-like domain-containing protein [Nannocystis punicea]|uniref:Carboxypeptidase regulatory-like domain-containing protein n=1 Tax=Nannocystis punicea TaxID=2995304 RepID=A0ABY7HGR2_9BACT|nr:carboxypeptidase regulatory-like domain-containing protein [Nannocystis poenicansa]WAS98079.1 carboxypeptidase regulatory-like domain-containing protein [Nannocystis poenicansa]
MRKQLGVFVGALVLFALSYWVWGQREGVPDGTTPDTVSEARVQPGTAAPPDSGATELFQAAAISGRVAVGAGALPPAQVCVQPAELIQDRKSWGRVSLFKLFERCVAASEDGKYRVDGLMPGRYRVSAGAEGYLVVQHRETPTQPWISLRLGEVREGLDFTLQVRGVPVRGVVRDVAGGTISGALVIDDLGGRALTDEDGNFKLWAPPQSSVLVSAFANGYTVDSNYALPPQTPLTLWLSPESVLRGRVVRSDTGAPLAGLALHLHEEGIPDAETATDGSFELRGLDPGRYKPYVRSDGWCGSAEPIVALGLGETSEPITITARPCRTLTAKVRVRPSGGSCASAQIEFLDVAGDIQRRAMTDADGTASLSGVEPGVYQVRIRCPGHIQRVPEPWVLGEEMKLEAVWEVEVGRTLRGVIRDHRGDPVPRAHVELKGEWGHIGADADDRGEFAATVQPGVASLVPYHPQHTNGTKLELEVSEKNDPPPVVLEFPASGGGVVSGRVRARTGALPPGLTVVARAIGNFAAKTAHLDEDGRYTLSGLERIPHEVVVQRSEGLGERASAGELAESLVVDLGERDNAEADFVVDLEGFAPLTGRVENDDASAEPDALVTVTNPMVSFERQRTLTDENGRFTVQVPGGTAYTVQVTARNGAVLKQTEVKPGEPLTLRFPATRRVCGVVKADVPVTENFTIDTDAGGGETFASGTERWCLDRVPVGARTFSARSQSFGTARRAARVTTTGDVPEVALTFAGRTSLHGRVQDGDGQPRPGFKVWVLDATGRLVGGNLYTDAAGAFTLAGAPAGELTVIPIAPGPFPDRDELLARGTTVQVTADKPSEVVLSVP